MVQSLRYTGITVSLPPCSASYRYRNVYVANKYTLIALKLFICCNIDKYSVGTRCKQITPTPPLVVRLFPGYQSKYLHQQKKIYPKFFITIFVWYYCTLCVTTYMK